jgi:hypothetical protein
MKAERVVAIHQPNFLPWLGYFDKLARADVFVLLDSVQFPRSGHGEWMNRVKLLVQGRPAWATVPILRRGVQAIHEVGIDESQPWRKKLLRTLEASYGRAPFYDETYALVQDVLGLETGNLADLNEHGVQRLAAFLGLDGADVLRSSTLDVDGEGSDLLAEITRAVEGTVYLSGDGADEYQREESYAERGLVLRYQRFEHPTYAQNAEGFFAGLSVVDALMVCGRDGVRRLLLNR